MGHNRKDMNRHGCFRRTSLLICSLVLLVLSVLSIGSLAVLKARTDSVVNTFAAREYNYTLVLDANGGTAGETTQLTMESKEQSYTFALPSDTADLPVYDGYTFLGWAETPDAQTAVWQPGGSVRVTVNDEQTGEDTYTKTIYAVWEQQEKVVEWEKVYGDPNAPYNDNDGKGPYYIRYVGGITHRTTVDVTGYGWEEGKILGTEITSTYKMFEKADHTQYVDFVILANSQKTDITENLIDGQTPGTVNVIYRDSTGNADFFYSDVAPNMPDTALGYYLYLEEGHLSEEKIVGAWGGTRQNTRVYEGTVPNIYVPAAIHTIHGLFYHNETIEKPLFDKNGNTNWTSLGSAFYYCSSLQYLPPDFEFPDTVTDMSCTFYQCFDFKGYEDTSKNFTLPSNLVNGLRTFYLCDNLTMDVTIPASITECERMFGGMPKSGDGWASHTGEKAAPVYDAEGNYVGEGAPTAEKKIIIRYYSVSEDIIFYTADDLDPYLYDETFLVTCLDGTDITALTDPDINMPSVEVLEITGDSTGGEQE